MGRSQTVNTNKAMNDSVQTTRRDLIGKWLDRPGVLALWCVLAAFGTYASMYGFRKPFTAATYTGTEWGDSLKIWLVTAQVLGYTVSKLIGIKVISEMQPSRRGAVLLGLIGIAHLALVGFALTPAPYNAIWLFVNGLPLGMVFGLVLGFLEGRRMTEFFVAGLCASFILADGLTKSVGSWLLESGVSEAWMPSTAGLIFLLPLVVFVWMLRQIPAPSPSDLAARSERTPMTRAERIAMFRRHGVSLICILTAYLLLTILRSVRADFAPEIWESLGFGSSPLIFTRSEFWVGLMVVLANGALFLIRDNRRAFFSSLWISAAGLILAVGAVVALKGGMIPPFMFMVLVGVGMYVPYVAVHTTVFERLIALTREKGNIGYLMYLADAIGYLGYCGVMLLRGSFQTEGEFLPFFLDFAMLVLLGALGFMALAIFLYSRMTGTPGVGLAGALGPVRVAAAERPRVQ